MSAEVALIQKVELRIALAKTPEEFQRTFDTYLPPLLLKFASIDPQVKSQIISTTKFLLSRFNITPELKVPIVALLNQVKTPNIPKDADATSVQTYSLLFISKGVERLDDNEKAELFPLLWNQISQFNPMVSSRLFNIAIKLLVACPNIDHWSNIDNENDLHFIFEKFYKFMLLHPTKLTENGQIDNNASQPGLSVQDVNFFYYQAGVIFNSSLLSNYKLRILKFLDNIEDKGKTLTLICASVDGDSVISSYASTSLKRIVIDYESNELISILIDLFIGRNSASQVKSQLQEKILSILCRSQRAAKSVYVNQIVDIGFESSNNKVKQGVISFIKWFTTINLSSNSSDPYLNSELLVTISNKLKYNLSLIESHPQNFKLYMTQREMQYETLGLLLKKSPSLITLPFIKFFFHMLEQEKDYSLKNTIQISLAGLGQELRSFDQTFKVELKKILKITILDESSDRIAKYAAVKLVNSVFEFNDTDARLLNILALKGSDSNEMVSLLEEAKKGLHPYWYNVINGLKVSEFPQFLILVREIMTNVDYFDTKCLSLAIEFTWRCLVMNSVENNKRALEVINIDQDWDIKLANAVEYDQEVRKCLIKYINANNKTDSDGDTCMDGKPRNDISDFLSISLSPVLKSDFDLTNLKIIYNILGMSTDTTIESIVCENLIDRLLNASLNLYSDEITHYTSAIIGILATHPKINDEVIAKCIGNLSKIHTPESLSAWGFIKSRLNLRGRLDPSLDSNGLLPLLKDIDISLTSSSSRMVKSSMDVISQLSIFGCLSLQSKEIIDLKSNIKEKVKKLLFKHNESAAMAWAHLSLSYESSDNDNDTLSEFEKALYDTYKTKHNDFLFTSGECWTIIAKGWESKVMKNMNDIQSSLTPSINPGRIEIIFKTVMKACHTTEPALRKAGCVWLLSLVQFCSDPIIEHKLKEVQHVFMRFLSEKEEIIQESASRGLSIVYESGDNDLQDILVHDLLASFTDSKKTTKDLLSEYVSQDTQLFDRGMLNTGNGQSISTYKDVLSLASEIGDPSLVYKFMSLAKNSALWTSRKGIAFGLGAILDKSKLDAMLSSNPKMTQRLIPKLWRYKHDSNPAVSRTMNDIWNSLILDPKKTIIDNFDVILRECLSSMGSKEWRGREAGAAALQSLLSQVEFSKFESQLEDIWTMAFRSIDDINENVRKEGEGLTRYLANTMTAKIGNSNGNSEVQSAILKQLVPFLLGNGGILSDVEEVKNFAFETIIKLINTNSNALKPFVTDMTQQMVSMMSSVEPQFINYIALNADKYKMEAKDLDSQRLSMIGSSPMMRAIEKLLDLLDDQNISEFIEMLAGCVKSAVGFPSKVAASKIIVDLVVRHLFIIKDYGDRLLKIASGQIKDRNVTIAQSYSMGCGYVVRCANIKAIQSLAKKLNKYYFEKKSDTDDDRLPMISSYTCECVLNFSNDKFQTIASAFLPLAFIGKHDPNDEIAKHFQTVWVDATSSSTGAIKLYFSEIINLMNKHIDSTNFGLRKTIALAIVNIINQLGPKINDINPSQLLKLYDILLNSLKGRSYEGKEKLLQSLVLLAENSKAYLMKNDELFEKVTERILNEAQRKNETYRKHSIISLGQLASAYPEHDSLQKEYLVLKGSLNDAMEE